jgi:hypothetical protein
LLVVKLGRILRNFSNFIENVGIERHGLALLAQAELVHEVGRNAIQVCARFAYQAGAFDTQETQVRFLRKILRLLSALQAAHEEAVKIGVIQLARLSRKRVLSSARLRFALSHPMGSPTALLS